ncbi:membrane-anchored adenylyl cyclase Cya_1 [Mycobacterium tuberculosis]|nr:membrane-anchored adenylyl cyclase Cya_1 [Mycobacterium tuberculosis]
MYEKLKGDFVFEERGEIAVKGKGLLRTWFLVGRRTAKETSESAEYPLPQRI